jgi:hypothetical protein
MMSCAKCTEYQDRKLVAYYRWKNANVGVAGCPEHVREIFEVLRGYQAKSDEAN